MESRSDEDRQDLEVLDAVAGLFARLIAAGEDMAKEFGVPPFVIKALHMIDTPLAMKELGGRMRCDPSFVTGIADTLEQRGLAVRESDPGDRRVKKLVLTSAGVELKRRMEQRMAAHVPWRARLSHDERACFLGLLHKIAPPLSDTDDQCPMEEVKDILTGAAAPPPATGPRPRRREAAAPARTAR